MLGSAERRSLNVDDQRSTMKLTAMGLAHDHGAHDHEMMNMRLTIMKFTIMEFTIMSS